ncbi:MAG: hypothetical protein CMG04_04800 [Candidatus Marinimicrobia bacterium]|nr:hypothetical protein [Candidatus Neomarinimicrobiota bacterium]|tara:strand:- start:240 stop:662 length:423 start_codon:yes stop_codon:yes gene_type:complete
MWKQNSIFFEPRPKGFYLITNEILKEIEYIKSLETGILFLFIKHTSASITLNENSDQLVRKDFESYFNRLVPENQSHYIHSNEGPDDMPAHLKTSILGSSIFVPIKNGKLTLGKWQGIYLCEHRTNGPTRNLIITVTGSN